MCFPHPWPCSQTLGKLSQTPLVPFQSCTDCSVPLTLEKLTSLINRNFWLFFCGYVVCEISEQTKFCIGMGVSMDSELLWGEPRNDQIHRVRNIVQRFSFGVSRPWLQQSQASVLKSQLSGGSYRYLTIEIVRA
jgi:hypothetical protein